MFMASVCWKLFVVACVVAVAFFSQLRLLLLLPSLANTKNVQLPFQFQLAFKHLLKQLASRTKFAFFFPR